MTKQESELSFHLATVNAEVEAEAWNIENNERRNSFLYGKLAELAMEDVDLYSDDVFDRIAA